MPKENIVKESLLYYLIVHPSIQLPNKLFYKYTLNFIEVQHSVRMQHECNTHNKYKIK